MCHLLGKFELSANFEYSKTVNKVVNEVFGLSYLQILSILKHRFYAFIDWFGLSYLQILSILKQGNSEKLLHRSLSYLQILSILKLKTFEEKQSSV